MSSVLLVSGRAFVVPAKHIAVLETYAWTHNNGYAATNGKPRDWLHRVIAQLEGWAIDGSMVDHINGEPYDNRIENLRVVSRTQNAWNARMNSNNTSGYRGVSFDCERGTWNAYITSNGKKRKIGRYRTREEASQAYETTAQAERGEYLRARELAASQKVVTE